MNIVILGCGKVGTRITSKLSESGHNITVIDKNRKAVESVTEQFDVIGFVGDGADADLLQEAQIGKADLMMAMTGDDEVNLISCLIARNLSKCRTIARMRNPIYENSLHIIGEDLGLAMHVNTERLAADEAARVIRFPSAMQIDTFNKGRVELIKYRIKEGTLLDGMRISDIPSKVRHDVLICAVERGEDVIIPNGDLVLQARDAISFATTPEREQGIFRILRGKEKRGRDCMIIGGSVLAYYLSRDLVRSGIRVTLIERNPEKCDRLSRDLPEVNVINADAVDHTVLLEEGLEHMDAVVTLTNSDETNILLSLYVNRLCSAKIITKMNRLERDSVIDEMDLDTILVPKDITADTVSSYVRAMTNSEGKSSIETLYTLVGGKAEAIEFRIGAGCRLIGVPLAKLRLKRDLIIACITRYGNIEIPNGRSVIREGDGVIVVTTRKGLNDIEDIIDEP